MGNGVFQVNNYEMEDISSYLGETSVNSGDLVVDSKKKFAGIKQQNLFVEGSTAIEEGIQHLSDSLENAKQVLIKGNEAAGELEVKMANEASSIEIPKPGLFALNANDNFSEFKSLYMNKTDGISVNNGSAQAMANMDDIDQVAREDMKDINKNYAGEEKPLDEYTVAKEDMKDINNESDTNQKNLNFGNVVNKANINELKDGVVDQKEATFNSSNINPADIKDISASYNTKQNDNIAKNIEKDLNLDMDFNDNNEIEELEG